MYGKQTNLSLSGSGGDVSDSHDFNQFLKASNKDDENRLFKKTMPATSKLTEKYGLQPQSQQAKGLTQQKGVGGQIYGQTAYSQQQIAQIPNMGGYSAAAQGMYANQYEDENMYYDSYGQDQYEFVDEYGNKYYDDGQGYMIDEQGYAYEYPEQIVEHDPYDFDVNLEEKKKNTKKPAKQPITTKKSKKDKEGKNQAVVQEKEEEEDEATKFKKRKEQLEAKRKALQEQDEAEKKRKKEQEEEMKKKEQEELLRQMNLNKQQNQKGGKMPYKKSLDIADAYQSIDEDDIEDSRHNAQSDQVSEEHENEGEDDEIEEENIEKPQLYDIDQTSKYYAQRTSELKQNGGMGQGKSKENLTDSNLYDSSVDKFGESSGRYGDPALSSSKNVKNLPISESGELEEKSKDYNNTSSSKLGQSTSQQYPPQQEMYDPDIMAKYMQNQIQNKQLSPGKKEESVKKDENNEKIVQKDIQKTEQILQKQDENQKNVQKEEIKPQQNLQQQVVSPAENNNINKQSIQTTESKQQQNQNKIEETQQINEKKLIVGDKQFSFEDIDHQQLFQNQPVFSNYQQQQESKQSPLLPQQQKQYEIQQQYQQQPKQQIFQQKNIQHDIRVIEEETEVQVLQLELQQFKEKYAEAYQKNILYQTEADELVQQLEFAEKKGKSLQNELNLMKSDNDNKMRVFKDRKDYFENIQENRAIQEIRQEFENDKENLLFEVEKLRDELEYTQKQLEKSQQKTVDFKKIDFMRNQQNAETKQLKQKVVELETIIEERNQFIKSQKKFKSMLAQNKQQKVGENERNDDEEEEEEEEEEEIQLEFEKELEIQEILIKGYQKENEKLYEENKQLSQKIQEYASKIFDENQKITNVQMKLAKQQGLYILADEEPNVRTLNELSSDIVISQNDLRSAQQRIIQMQEHIENLNKINEEREIEMKYEIDKLRQNKMQLEVKLEGFDLNKIKEDEVYYKQMEQQYQEMLNSQQSEIKNLKYKLTWYIENSENVNKKQEEIREKEERIQELQKNIENILSDPNSNMDKKTKQFQNMMLRDQQRIKQLERDIKQLEETLTKKNPQALKQLQVEKEEKSQLQEYKKKIKILEEELQKKTEEYELKVNEFRIEFDKMQLAYQQKLNETSNQQQQSKEDKMQMMQSQKIKFMTHDSFFKQDENDNISNLNQQNNNLNSQQQQGLNKLAEDNQLLKERIKELEKEVNDAKNYYVKKVKTLKNDKKDLSSIPPKNQIQKTNVRPASSSGNRATSKNQQKNTNQKPKLNNFIATNQDVEEFQQTQEMSAQMQQYKKQIEDLEQKIKDQAQQQLTNQLLTTLTGKQVNVDESVMLLQQNLASQDKQIKLMQQQQQILLEIKEEFFGLVQILLKYLEKPLTAPILKINQFISGIKEQTEFMEYNRLKTSLQNLIEFINELLKSNVLEKEITQDFSNCLLQLNQYVTENGVTQIQWNFVQDSVVVIELRYVQLMGQFYLRNKVVTTIPTTLENINNINQKSNKNLKLINNFMLDDSLQISDIKKQNVLQIEENNKENIDLHNQLTFLKDQINQLQTQKQYINTNKNPNQMEFSVLEKKLEMLEQSYLRKEMEINFAINSYMNTGGVKQQQNFTEIHQHYNMVINLLKKQIAELQQEHQIAILKKNAQIEECGQEVAKFMKEMILLKNIKQTYMK